VIYMGDTLLAIRDKINQIFESKAYQDVESTIWTGNIKY
jgi:hypothetical protein